MLEATFYVCKLNTKVNITMDYLANTNDNIELIAYHQAITHLANLFID